MPLIPPSCASQPHYYSHLNKLVLQYEGHGSPFVDAAGPAYAERPAEPVIGFILPLANIEAQRQELAAVQVGPTAHRVGSTTSRSEFSWGGRRQNDYSAMFRDNCINAADYVLQRLAPCWHQSFLLMDHDTVRLVNCDVALGLWGLDAIQMSQLATEDSNCIHTLGLSLKGVELIRNTMIHAEVRTQNGEMSLGNVSDRALAASAVRMVVRELEDLPPDTEALWVQLPAKPFQYDDYMIGDRELEWAVAAALRAPYISVLALQANPADQLSELFPQTWGRICRALASMRTVKTLEFRHPTNNVTALQRWPFGGFDELLKRHLATHSRSERWQSVRRLSFMYLDPVRLDAEHFLDARRVRYFLGSEPPVRELAFFFNFPDLGDSIGAFLPLVSGYFYGELSKFVSRLLVHTSTHLTFLAQADVNPCPMVAIRLHHHHPKSGIRPIAVAHYLPAVHGMTAAERRAMLRHLAVVLPRVQAAAVQLPLELCEIAGEPGAECRIVHREAAAKLRTVLAVSRGLARLKIESASRNKQARLVHSGFGKESNAPWYAQALADAGPLPQLRVLSIRTRVSDAERGRHLERILDNNPSIHTLMLHLHDRIVFSGSISSLGTAADLRLNGTGTTCIVRDAENGRVPGRLCRCLRVRYQPLIRALQRSRIRRIVLRPHLAHRVAGEVVPEHVRAWRNDAAAALECNIVRLFTENLAAVLEPASGRSALFWHERLSREFVIESNLDGLFPSLYVEKAGEEWFAHQQSDVR